jgi:DNA polymerase
MTRPCGHPAFEDIYTASREVGRHLELLQKLGVEFLPVPQAGPNAPSCPDDRKERLEELYREASACRRCAISRTRTRLVFGAGSPCARLMFIGEAPGYHEDQQGIPFVGPAGQLLTRIIQAIGLTRDEVYIANILKCRPPENRNPTPEETLNCYPFLMRQIELIKPAIIVALGGVAAKKLLKTDRPTGALRGEFHDFQNTRLIVTFHPAYLLRNPADKAKTWEDMKLVRDHLRSLGDTGK